MIHAFEFWGTRNLHQKCVIRDKVKKIYTTLYNALHQNFYTSCEIFTPAALAPLATFSISACSQCDYKATTNPNLKRHVEAINELVCYSCSQCYYKATTNDSLKKHVESIHKSSTPVMDVILKEQQRLFWVNTMKQVMQPMRL